MYIHTYIHSIYICIYFANIERVVEFVNIERVGKRIAKIIIIGGKMGIILFIYSFNRYSDYSVPRTSSQDDRHIEDRIFL